ncbi:MAG: hypothetical protein ACRDSR_08585 [Pseudonocardiaceae bacterium]
MGSLSGRSGTPQLWWILRRPLRALGYDAARAMFTRANAALGSNWSLHDLRHTAAYRMEGSEVASDGRETAGQHGNI